MTSVFSLLSLSLRFSLSLFLKLIVTFGGPGERTVHLLASSQRGPDGDSGPQRQERVGTLVL